MATLTPNSDAEVINKEPGVLTGLNGSVSITGTGFFTISFTVPAGKVYLPKVVDVLASTGVYTLDYVIYTVYAPDTTGVSFDSKAVVTGRTAFVWDGLPMYISAGGKIEMTIHCSAWTSVGDTLSRGLVNIFDE